MKNKQPEITKLKLVNKTNETDETNETNKPLVNESLVKMLSDLLKEAEEGEIHSIAIAGVYSDRESSFNCFSCGDAMLLFAEINVLSRDFCDTCIDLRRKPMDFDL